MLPIENIPPDNHLYRKVPDNCYDISSGLCTEGAFLLRKEIKEKYLSVDWAERTSIKTSSFDPKTKKHLKIAELKVQDTLDLGLFVEHKPSKNPAHSGIFGDALFDDVLSFIKASELVGISTMSNP